MEDMIKQYRNHTSVIIWGVRINESWDDDEFRENQCGSHVWIHQTDGSVLPQKEQLVEAVYTYNDFVHDGKKKGCEPKKR